MARAKRRSGISQRQEALILLPLALLVLAVVSTFALFAYRNTVALLVEAREAEAARLGRQISGELTLGPWPDANRLRRRFPNASVVNVLDSKGNSVVSTGIRARTDSQPTRLSWLRNRELAQEDRISAVTYFKKAGERYAVQVDLPAPILRSRERGLSILTPVALTVNGAITLLVLFYLRRFLAPIDQLVERAKRAGQEVPETDEVAFLVETFEKALGALAVPPSDVDEMKALQGTFAKSLESGVLLCDASGLVLALNDLGSRLLGISSVRLEEPLAVALDKHPELAQLVERAVRHGEAVQRRELTLTKEETEITLGVTVHPLRRDDSAVRGFLVIFADLTAAQAKLEEERLIASLSQIGELAAGVAHELRNSLATLRGYLTLIEKGPEEDSIADYLQEIRHESDHLQRVLEDFLTFARPGTARPQEVDLLGLVHRAAADPALQGAPIRVEPSGGGAATSNSQFLVQGDSQLLERALRNILNNAVEAQKSVDCQEAIHVRLAVRGGGVEICLDDRGPGLSPEVEEKLFDPFFSQRPGGVGMGLALTRRIALLHAGRVELRNREGGGSRATFWIPFGKVDTIGNETAESPN